MNPNHIDSVRAALANAQASIATLAHDNNRSPNFSQRFETTIAALADLAECVDVLIHLQRETDATLTDIQVRGYDALLKQQNRTAAYGAFARAFADDLNEAKRATDGLTASTHIIRGAGRLFIIVEGLVIATAGMSMKLEALEKRMTDLERDRTVDGWIGDALKGSGDDAAK